MTHNFNDYWNEGYCPEPKVIVEEPRTSLVLDQNGNPFILERKTKLGFDLTPRKGKT